MKDIKDYLHLYLGCEVIYTPQNVIGVLEIVNIPADEVSVSTVKSCYPLIKNIKLILRPLSDMTEEEKKESNEIYYRDKIQLLAIMDVAHFELCRYLLCKGFDIFGLIDAGLAIDKTKQP